MTENSDLYKKREELIDRLASDDYRTLVDIILDGVGRFVQKLTRSSKPSPYWFNAIILGLVTVLISLLTSLFFGEYYPLRREFILVEISIVVIAFANLVTLKMNTRAIFSSFHERLLIAIESEKDLSDLQSWLVGVCNVKKNLALALILGIVVGFYGSILLSIIRGGFIGVGPTILLEIASIQAAIGLYPVIYFLMLPIRLSHFQFKLYAADPSTSEVIDHLSDMLNYIVYIGTVNAVLISIFVAWFELLSTLAGIVPLILFIWAPLTAFFLINQYALAKIITRAKWKKLNEIQAKIETLEAKENIADKDTMEAVNRLMDYHDRIKATRNSALDLRASLNFLNSLLLPVLGFALANLDRLLEFFSN